MVSDECKYDFLESVRQHLESLYPKIKMLLKWKLSESISRCSLISCFTALIKLEDQHEK